MSFPTITTVKITKTNLKIKEWSQTQMTNIHEKIICSLVMRCVSHI